MLPTAGRLRCCYRCHRRRRRRRCCRHYLLLTALLPPASPCCAMIQLMAISYTVKVMAALGAALMMAGMLPFHSPASPSAR